MNLSLILAEGPHDCAVLSKVLRGCLSYSEWERPLADLPQPLPQWFEKWHAGHFPDLSKRPSVAWKLTPPTQQSPKSADTSDAAYTAAPKPSPSSAFESPSKQHWVLLLTSSGAAPWVIVRYCMRLKQALEAPGSTLNNLSVCFFCDADQKTAAEAFQQKLKDMNDAIQQEPRNIPKDSWKRLAIEQTSDPSPFPLCISVFPGPNALSGTLEDLILPVLERRHPTIMKAAADFVKQHKQASLMKKTQQYQKKAQIVIAGQVFHPDSACGTLLQKSDFAIDSKTVGQQPELSRLGDVLKQHFDASFL